MLKGIIVLVFVMCCAAGTWCACAPWTAKALVAINNLRTKHGAGALTLKDELCDSSREWATNLAEKVTVLKPSGVGGENMAVDGDRSAVGEFTYTLAINRWYAEKDNYDYDKGASSNGATIGNFTQLVWKGTKEMGMARYFGGYWYENEQRTWYKPVYFVARFSPAGNVDGAYTDNVFPAGSA